MKQKGYLKRKNKVFFNKNHESTYKKTTNDEVQDSFLGDDTEKIVRLPKNIYTLAVDSTGDIIKHLTLKKMILCI